MKTGLYRHYKGGFYQVLGIAAHSETGEEMVVYVSLDASKPGPRMRVRPLHGPAGFMEQAKNPADESQMVPRFMWVRD